MTARPARDPGITCPVCWTLNPASAAACVRCNGPLGTPQTPARSQPPAPGRNPPPGVEAPGSPGVAVPGMSRPAPYGDPVAVAPAAGRESRGRRTTAYRTPGQRTRRRVLLIGNAAVGIAIVVVALVLWFTRPHDLDTGSVAHQLAAALHADVTCPGGIHAEAGTTFRCSLRYADHRTGAVLVTVADSSGHYRWRLTPSVSH